MEGIVGNAAEETITSELLENMAKSIEQAEKSENKNFCKNC